MSTSDFMFDSLVCVRARARALKEEETFLREWTQGDDSCDLAWALLEEITNLL